MRYVIYRDDELAHHGVLGQKHGQRNGPPYPLSAGAHSASEQKAGWRKSLKKGAEGAKKAAAKTAEVAKKTVDAAKVLKAKHDANAEERKVKREAKAEQKAAKAKERLEKEKAEAIIKGDLEAAKKNLEQYSDQELNALINRYNTIEKLHNSGKSKIEKGLEFVDKATKAANTVSNALESGVKAYNTIHKLQNALDGGNRRVLDMNKTNEVKKDVTERVYNVDKNGKEILQKETITDKDNNRIIKNYSGKQQQKKTDDDKDKKGAKHSALDGISEDELRGILADENFLEHHGIKGQKWGKRNGPPYPLSTADHSVAEKRLNHLKEKADNIESKKKTTAAQKIARLEKRANRIVERQEKRDERNIKRQIRKSINGSDELDNADIRKTASQLKSSVVEMKKANDEYEKKAHELCKNFTMDDARKVVEKETFDREFFKDSPGELFYQDYIIPNSKKEASKAYDAWHEYEKKAEDLTDEYVGKMGKVNVTVSKYGFTKSYQQVVYNSLKVIADKPINTSNDSYDEAYRSYSNFAYGPFDLKGGYDTKDYKTAVKRMELAMDERSALDAYEKTKGQSSSTRNNAWEIVELAQMAIHDFEEQQKKKK